MSDSSSGDERLDLLTLLVFEVFSSFFFVRTYSSGEKKKESSLQSYASVPLSSKLASKFGPEVRQLSHGSSKGPGRSGSEPGREHTTVRR